MALYWGMLPFQLAFTWLDVSRQRAPVGTWRRVVAARRQLCLVPGSALAYLVGLGAAFMLLETGPEDAHRIVGLAGSGVLLVSAWHDAERALEAWHDSRFSGWWRRLRRRVAARLAGLAPRPAPVPIPIRWESRAVPIPSR